MYVLSLVGGQFGDEGTGKITDMLAEHADTVARYSGSNEADHSITKDGVKHSLHILPSGVFYPKTNNVIGAGVKVDPVLLVDELTKLKKNQVSPNLIISPHAHLIMEWHLAFEAGNGFGAAACTQTPADFTIRAKDLLSPKLAEKIEYCAKKHLVKLIVLHPRFEKHKNLSISEIYTDKALAEEFEIYISELIEKYEETAEELQEYIHEIDLDGKFLLGEGVQGTMIDPLHGTFPDIVPTHPIAGGMCTGLGIGPTAIDDVLGFFKAYETRIGEGLFTTELRDDTGKYLRKKGAEFDTIDGRPRRCGWLNLEQAKRAVKLNGMTWMNITKLDVLDELPEIKVFTGKLYKSFKGWEKSTTGCKTWDDLPEAAQVYLEYLQKELCSLAMVSVGPSREQTIILPDFVDHLKNQGISFQQ